MLFERLVGYDEREGWGRRLSGLAESESTLDKTS